MVEIIVVEQNKEKKWNEGSLRDLWDNIKCTTIQITGIPEEEKDKEFEKILKETIVKNFPNTGKEIVN